MDIVEENKTDEGTVNQPFYMTKEEIEARIAELKPLAILGDTKTQADIQHLEELLLSFDIENNTSEKAVNQPFYMTKEEIEARIAELKPLAILGDTKVQADIQHLEELLLSFDTSRQSVAIGQINSFSTTTQPTIQPPSSQQSSPAQAVQRTVPVSSPFPQTEMQADLPFQSSYTPVDCLTSVLQQTIPQQTPSAPVVQPTAQVMPPIQQRGAQSEKYHHNYVPIVRDDVIGCVTTVFKMTVDASNRLSMADYARLSQECMRSSKRNSTDIAYLYIHSAEDYSTKIRLDISYIHAHENRERKVIFVDKEACEQNRLYDELTRNGIHCFNTSLSHRVISENLYQLILYKMPGTKHELPEECGFAEIDGAWCFVTEEYCEQKGIPSVTDKSFSVKLKKAVSSEQAETYFIRFARTCHDIKQLWNSVQQNRISARRWGATFSVFASL